MSTTKSAFNGLSCWAVVTADYSLFHHVVDRIYAEFISARINKEQVRAGCIPNDVSQVGGELFPGDELFFQIVEEVIKKVQESSNYASIPIDELQLCVNILAVDAFIRCKIFRNPGAAYVAA